MRAKILLGITVVLLLQGCGRKGPLKLSVSQTQTSGTPLPQQGQQP